MAAMFDVVYGVVTIRTSKTNTGRTVPFSLTVAKALDRYIRGQS